MKVLTSQEVKELRRTERIAIDKRMQELSDEGLIDFLSVKEQKKVWKRIKELWVWIFSY